MVFNSRIVPVFMLWLPKISGSSITYFATSRLKGAKSKIVSFEMINKSYTMVTLGLTMCCISAHDGLIN